MVPPLSYCSNTQKILVILLKVQVKLNTHVPYACGFDDKATLYSGAWLYAVHRTCAETAAVLCGTSHVTTKQCCKYTGEYSCMHCVKLQSHIQSILLKCSGSAKKQR